eukprot:763811-Hanusia_phi.AAC.2
MSVRLSDHKPGDDLASLRSFRSRGLRCSAFAERWRQSANNIRIQWKLRHKKMCGRSVNIYPETLHHDDTLQDSIQRQA